MGFRYDEPGVQLISNEINLDRIIYPTNSSRIFRCCQCRVESLDSGCHRIIDRDRIIIITYYYVSIRSISNVNHPNAISETELNGRIIHMLTHCLRRFVETIESGTWGWVRSVDSSGRFVWYLHNLTSNQLISGCSIDPERPEISFDPEF